MKKLIISTVILFSAYAQAWTCDNFVVNGTQLEKEMTCQALDKAKEFYTKYNIQVPASDAVVNVHFKNLVELPEVDSKGTSTFSGGIRVLAFFDRESKTLNITSFNEKWLKHKKRTYFGQQYTEAYYKSVLMHELMHTLNKSFYTYKDYGHAQDEYIAYAAQIDMLDQKSRDKVLNWCKKDCELNSETSINDIVHFSAPHKFGVMSYRHFKSEEGGEKMLRRIYSGDFKPIDFSVLQ